MTPIGLTCTPLGWSDRAVTPKRFTHARFAFRVLVRRSDKPIAISRGVVNSTSPHADLNCSEMYPVSTPCRDPGSAGRPSTDLRRAQEDRRRVFYGGRWAGERASSSETRSGYRSGVRLMYVRRSVPQNESPRSIERGPWSRGRARLPSVPSRGKGWRAQPTPRPCPRPVRAWSCGVAPRTQAGRMSFWVVGRPTAHPRSVRRC